MRLKRMLEDQAAFNRLIFDKTNADERSLVVRIKDLTMGAIEESLEFIRTFEYKVHRRSKLRLPNVAHSHEELIDLFKYWLSLVDATDFPLERLEELYYAKSRVVQYRFQEEWQKRIEGRCVVVDIDGVLADYITGICNWGMEYGPSLLKLDLESAVRLRTRLDGIVQQRRWVDSQAVGLEHFQWQTVKHHFRTNGGKRQLPVFGDAKPFLEWCRKRGWTIVLITSRPIVEYPNIFTDTLTWLHENELPFDYVWWSTEKGERLEEEAHVALLSKIVFAVDDSERFVKQFRSKGIDTFHLDRSLSFNDTDPTYDRFRIRSLHDLMARWYKPIQEVSSVAWHDE